MAVVDGGSGASTVDASLGVEHVGVMAAPIRREARFAGSDAFGFFLDVFTGLAASRDHLR